MPKIGVRRLFFDGLHAERVDARGISSGNGLEERDGIREVFRGLLRPRRKDSQEQRQNAKGRFGNCRGLTHGLDCIAFSAANGFTTRSGRAPLPDVS